MGASLLLVGVLFGPLAVGRVVLNPYEGVDWETAEQHSANLHTHTTHSDGTKAPHERIDEYYEHGYTILSLTDHDTHNPQGPLTYPWSELGEMEHWSEWKEDLLMWRHRLILHNGEYYLCEATHFSTPKTEPGRGDEWRNVWKKTAEWENRDPTALGMIAVVGAEISSTVHIGSHFNDFTGAGSSNEDYVLHQIQSRGGLAQFFHPGRYTHDDPTQLVDWYAHYFLTYECLVGLEVYNGADHYPTDRELWDNILMKTLPDKPVWAFGNDDNHESVVGRDFLASWTVFVLDELTPQAVQSAYRSGALLACNKTDADAPDPPRVHRITVAADSVITIDATGYDEIRWIANGRVVADTHVIDVTDIDVSYVRAKLVKYGERGEARTLTQPFVLES